MGLHAYLQLNSLQSMRLGMHASVKILKTHLQWWCSTQYLHIVLMVFDMCWAYCPWMSLEESCGLVHVKSAYMPVPFRIWLHCQIADGSLIFLLVHISGKVVHGLRAVIVVVGWWDGIFESYQSCASSPCFTPLRTHCHSSLPVNVQQREYSTE